MFAVFPVLLDCPSGKKIWLRSGLDSGSIIELLTDPAPNMQIIRYPEAEKHCCGSDIIINLISRFRIRIRLQPKFLIRIRLVNEKYI